LHTKWGIPQTPLERPDASHLFPAQMQGITLNSLIAVLVDRETEAAHWAMQSENQSLCCTQTCSLRVERAHR